MFGALLQIIAAFILVIFLFAIGYFIYNMEAINSYKNARTVKKTIPIFQGVIDIGTYSTKAYNTLNKNASSYREIVPSYNQAAGAEFTYNFWLYQDGFTYNQPNPDAGSTIKHTDTGLNANNFILFLHGDKNPYDYKNICGVNKADIKIKCPLVKLENNGDVLTVEFNTMSSPDVVREQARNVCRENSTDWKFMNSHKVSIRDLKKTTAEKKWQMITIVIQDTSPNDPLPIRNKIRCRIYVNGTLELDRYVDAGMGLYSGQTLLRRNTSFFYVSPKITFTPYKYSVPGREGSKTSSTSTTTSNAYVANPANDNKLLMSDLTYFNYALASSDIRSLFDKGYTSVPATTLSDEALELASITSPSNKATPTGQKEYATL